MKITLIDYGAGNLPSIERALHRLGMDSERAVSAAHVAKASVLILPGVGHFAALIRALDNNGVRGAIVDAISRGIPFLGICLGLQALYQSSAEAPDLLGLNIFAGRIDALAGPVKLPHMGWNQLQKKSESRLLQGIQPASYFYFAHSYAATQVGDEARATCNYGTKFVAIAERENVFAVQFHPEKSGDAGRCVLQNFLRIAA